MVPPPGLMLVMAPACPGGWYGHTLSIPWLQHEGTSSAAGTRGEACRVPTGDVHLDIHLCQAASLTDMPFSSTSLSAAMVFAVCFSYFKLSSVWQLK